MTATKDLASLVLVEGDDIPFTWTFTNADRSLFDFSDVTKAWFTLKMLPGDADENALAGTPINSVDHPAQLKYGVGDGCPGPGKLWMKLLREETGGLAAYKLLHCDIQVIKAGDLRTLVVGTMKFQDEITQAIV